MVTIYLFQLYLSGDVVNEAGEGPCGSVREQVCVRSSAVCKLFDISVWTFFMRTSAAAAL